MLRTRFVFAGLLLLLLLSSPHGARARNDRSTEVRVEAEIRDGRRPTCDQPPERVRIAIDVPGRRPVFVTLDESECGFGGIPPREGALVEVSCFCAGAGATLWVMREGDELVVYEGGVSEGEDSYSEVRARVRVPTGMNVRVDTLDTRSETD